MTPGLVRSEVFASVTQPRDQFEYIVVGSGAGGGPVASNLAKAGYRVLLLEAGGQEEPTEYTVPAFHSKSTEQPDLAWNFFVDHYADAKRQSNDSKYVPGKGVFYPRAGTLGGCTAHNAMITMYPDNRDWDDIARLMRDPSWLSSPMRDYFEKIENASYTVERLFNFDRRGFKGWLNTEQNPISLLKKDGQLLRMVAAAAFEQGLALEGLKELLQDDYFRLKLDPNAWTYVCSKLNGLINPPKATLKGRRVGSRELLLKTAQDYPGFLTIRTHSLATRVLFAAGSENRAIGVEYLEGSKLYKADPRSTDATRSLGVKREVFATREVILAGGAFNTPQLLMLSGIGSEDDLRPLGITVRANRPGVGRNLQDRYEVGVVTEMKDDFALTKECTFGEVPDPCFDEYQRDPAGSTYASNGVLIGLMNRSNPQKLDPDLFVFGIPGKFGGYAPGWSKDAFSRNHFTWAVLKGHTLNNAGFVKLKSSDPTDTPAINFKYFDEGSDSSGDDLNAVVEGVKLARRINGRWPARALVKSEVLPGLNIETDDDIKGFIKSEAWGHHASCSCKMGPVTDPMAVVDSKFQVYGTQGLRIVDASVFPKIPGLFIAVPIYMIAEKASEDLIKAARAADQGQRTR